MGKLFQKRATSRAAGFQSYTNPEVAMDLTIELDRETDGRWIADVPELNILQYGATREEAICKAEEAARVLIAD